MSSLSSSSSGSLDSIGWNPNQQIIIVAMLTFCTALWVTESAILAILIIFIVVLPFPWILVRLPWLQRKLLFHSWYYKADKPLDDPCLWGVNRAVNKPIGGLGCWYVPCECRGSPVPSLSWDCVLRGCLCDTVVIYCHGSSGSRGNDYRVYLVNFLSSLGCAVFTFDYRGYADSGGASSEVNSVEDARRVLETAALECPDKRVVLYGHSMGTGVVCQAAHQLLSSPSITIDKIVLEAPFLSIPDVLLESPITRFINNTPIYKNFVWKFVDKFVSKDVISELDDVLILFAENDEVIPARHAIELNKLCKSSTLHLIKEGGHNFLINQDSVKIAILNHLNRR